MEEIEIIRMQRDALLEAVKAFLIYDADEAGDGIAMMLAYEKARTLSLKAAALMGFDVERVTA